MSPEVEPLPSVWPRRILLAGAAGLLMLAIWSSYQRARERYLHDLRFALQARLAQPSVIEAEAVAATLLAELQERGAPPEERAEVEALLGALRRDAAAIRRRLASREAAAAGGWEAMLEAAAEDPGAPALAAAMAREALESGDHGRLLRAAEALEAALAELSAAPPWSDDAALRQDVPPPGRAALRAQLDETQAALEAGS